MPSTASRTTGLVAAFRQGLRELGYGEDLRVLYRYSEGSAEQVRKIAGELARDEVPIIVTTTDAVARAVAREAPRAAIVMVNASDPVGTGLVASLAHPAGKVTGLTNFSPEISGKRIELLKECVPTLARVAYLLNPDLPGAQAVLKEVKDAADRFALEVLPLEARKAADISAALGELPARATGLLVQSPNPLLYTERALVCRLARARRVPSIFNRVEYVQAGGLLSYGPNVADMYRRAARYVDRILKGARPGDLPVEQPSKFELAINLETARVLGVAVPRQLLGRAGTVVG